MQIKTNRFILVLTLLLTGVLILTVVQVVLTLRNTSRLEVSSFDPTSTITISGASTNAVQIGTGKAHIRVKPGDYYVAAIGAGQQAGKIIHLTPHSVLSISLSPLKTPSTTVNSVDGIQFNNTDELLQNGLSSAQLANLQQLYFQYKNTAKVITINKGSVVPGIRDVTSTDFNITYTGDIDGARYSAVVVYSGQSVVYLTLSNDSGTQLFTGVLPQDGIEGGHD